MPRAAVLSFGSLVLFLDLVGRPFGPLVRSCLRADCRCIKNSLMENQSEHGGVRFER